MSRKGTDNLESRRLNSNGLRNRGAYAAMQFLNVNLSNFDKYFQNNKSLADFNSIITQSSVNGTFESILKLVGIDYTFTGSYYCQTNSSRDYEWSYLLASKQATRIYLFVAGL